MSLKSIRSIIKHSSDTGGGSSPKTPAAEPTVPAAESTVLDTARSKIKTHYNACCDRISDNFAKVFEGKGNLLPIENPTVVNQNLELSRQKYESTYTSLIYSGFREIREEMRLNAIPTEHILHSSNLSGTNRQLLSSLLVDGDKSIVAQIDATNPDDLNLVLEDFQKVRDNYSLKPSSRETMIRNLATISNNTRLHRNKILSQYTDPRLVLLDPAQQEVVEKLKVNSYLRAIVDEVEGYSNQIRDVFDIEFEEENTQQNIDFFNQNLSTFRKNLPNMSSEQQIEMAEKFGILLDPNHPQYISEFNEQNIGMLYDRLFETLEDLTVTTDFLTRFLTEDSIDEPFTKKTKDNGSIHECVTQNPITQKNCSFKIYTLPTKTRLSQSRVRFGVVKPGDDRMTNNVRLDASDFGTVLDLDFGIVSILLPSTSQNVSVTYHHLIESRTSKDAQSLGVNLPFSVVIPPESGDKSKIPGFDKVATRMRVGLESKLTNVTQV